MSVGGEHLYYNK